jgi:hypothetical protein
VGTLRKAAADQLRTVICESTRNGLKRYDPYLTLLLVHAMKFDALVQWYEWEE